MSRSTTLAIVHPVDKLQGSDDAVRTQVWAETTHLLTPMLGKLAEDIAKNMEQYAISLVRLYAEEVEDK